MERVLNLGGEPPSDAAHTRVVSVDERPWIAGSTVSEIEVMVGGMVSDEDEPPRRR